MRIALLGLLSIGLLGLGGCATATCETDRQCDPGAYCSAGRCTRDCRTSFDCTSGQVCDATRRCSDPNFDAGVDAIVLPFDGGVVDTGIPGVDTGGIDTGTMPIDTGVDAPAAVLGRYLDRCVSDANCMSGRCVDDVGGARMCTVTCSGHSECAAEHVCAAGVCRRDDTGAICSGASGCVLGLCAGNPATGAGECTRPCGGASDCAAGYACSDAGGTFICVNIERSCAQCSTGLCLGAQGCTSTCRTASDCPATLPGMPYSCSGGQCVPNAAVFGPDPIGAACASSGTTTCRSGACLTDDFGASYCTQRCTESGGCGPGFGCVFDDGAGYICLRGGSGALGSACTTGNQCDSGICATPGGFCTRLCTADARCPSDMRCGTGPGATCVR